MSAAAAPRAATARPRVLVLEPRACAGCGDEFVSESGLSPLCLRCRSVKAVKAAASLRLRRGAAAAAAFPGRGDV